jgi:hypothetical protein
MGGNVDVLDCLVSMLSTDNSGFQYSALGVLKNLSVAPPNKKRLLQGTVIAGLHTTLKSPQEPLQYLSASTLRAICIDQDADSVRQLAEYPGMIARLTHLGKQVRYRLPSPSRHVAHAHAHSLTHFSAAGTLHANDQPGMPASCPRG